MHVLEFAGGLELHPRLRFRPDSGRLLRIDGSRRTVVDGELSYPTALTLDRAGAFLIADRGAMSAPGSGRLLRHHSCSTRSQ
jgi:hypothetical protein